MEYPTCTSPLPSLTLVHALYIYAEANILPSFFSHGFNQNFIAIPKSVSQSRIESNAQIFDFQLDEEDMKQVCAPPPFLLRSPYHPKSVPHRRTSANVFPCVCFAW